MIAIVAIVIFFYLMAVLSKRSNEDALVDIDFSKIDEMEGHRFEYFIAKVLRENGFKNVNVTKASGDYGVCYGSRYRRSVQGQGLLHICSLR